MLPLRGSLLVHQQLNCIPPPFLLQDPSLLNGKVTLHQVTAGTVLSRQGDQVSKYSLGVERGTKESGLISSPVTRGEKTHTLIKNTLLPCLLPNLLFLC